MKRIIEHERLATIVVDVQNDFCPGGALAVEDGDQVVEPLNQVMHYTREKSGLVIVTRDWHPARTPHFEAWPPHCIAGTKGAEFHPNLDIQPGDIIISKGIGRADDYSGFDGAADDGTTIESLIRPHSARERVNLLIGGLATDYCALNTVLGAAELAKKQTVGQLAIYALTDAMRAVNLNPGDDRRAIAQMEAAGAILTTSRQIIDS